MQGIVNQNNVIGINKRLGVYKYRHERVTDTQTLPTGKEIVLDRIEILLDENKNGIVRSAVHPISEFLHQPKENGGVPDIKTQAQIASYITNFLNFVLIEHYPTYRISSLKELSFEHGEDYLNVYGHSGRKGVPVSNETVKRCEHYLTKFYFFLASKQLLNNHRISDFLVKERSESIYGMNKVIKTPQSPFRDVIYPQGNEKDINLIHDIPKQLVISFILTAFSYTPRIALGVAFQCFGGLRASEVVSLTQTGITASGEDGKYGLKVKIQKSNFRQELKSTSGQGSPKKPRRQAIFPFNGELLQMLYREHKRKYVSTDGSGALFGNKNGAAMAKFTYERDFRKLKNKFLELLIKSKDPLLNGYGLELSSAKWSTHIGRGIFSNLIAEDATNVLQIMKARGDDNPMSSLVYLHNTNKMLNILKGNYDDMYKDLLLASDEVKRLKTTNEKGDDIEN